MKVNSLDNVTAANLGRDIARSLRPQMIVLSWIVYSCVITIHSGFKPLLLGLGLVLFIAMYGIVALQNDLSDIETDKINQRHDIPYSTGKLSDLLLIRTMFVLSIIVTAAGLIVGYQTLPWIALYMFLGYAYSGPLNIKSRGILAALLLGFCYGAMPWIIAASIIDQVSNQHLLTAAFISLIFSSGIIVIKDFKDVIGDTATGKRTILVSRGPTYTRRYYLTVTSTAYILTVVYFYITNQSIVFALVGAVAAIVNYLLLADKSLLSTASARSIRGKWSRAIFFVTILAAYYTTTLTN